VGTIKRKKGASKQNSFALEDKPLSILHAGPGKPGPSDAYLFRQRESLIWLIETYWAEIRWPLVCARTPDDVRSAFRLVSQHTNANALAPMVRENSEFSTVESIRQVRKQLGDAVENERSLDGPYHATLNSFQDAERRAFTLSAEYKNQLKVELVRRQKNVREIRIQVSNQKGQILRARLRKQNEKELSTEVVKPDVAALEGAVRKLQHECEADEVVCSELTKQIESITPENGAIAAEESTRRKLLLEAAAQELSEARSTTQGLEHKLNDQESFYFRTQILDFINEGRYTLTPRSLANAIAGLPYMTARHSAERCAKLESKVARLRNHRTLLFVTSVWNRRNIRGNLRLVEWFEREIKKMPKFRITAKRRITNEFRAYLCEGWYYLKQAISETDRLKLDPRATPDAITVRYLKSSSGTENPVESTRAEAARITD